MTIAIVLIAAVVIFAVYWFVIRKPEAEPALPPKKDPERLPEKPTPAKPPRASRDVQDAAPHADDKKPTVQTKPEKTDRQEAAPDADKEAEASAPAETESGDASRDSSPAPVSDKENISVNAADEVSTDGESPKAPAHKPNVQLVRKGLERSRQQEGFFGRLARLITGKRDIDPTIVDEIEEVLITSDVGVKTTTAILERLRAALKNSELKDSDAVWSMLRAQAKDILSIGSGGVTITKRPTVVLLVGVNGSGKTTTIGKIATQFTNCGKRVTLAAGDTFRAAAVQQLTVWAERVGCDIVKGKDRSDPGAVIFDAIKQATQNQSDLVLVDTAGRLHTNTNLMDELKKIVRTMDKAMPGAPHEILLVIDATNGQNALAQSRQFSEALPLTGIVLTKLDGTAKGGVILGVCDELGVPVRYIGLGEKSDDLRQFDASEFVEALLGGDSDDVAAA